jgi:hypothetical protein
LSTYEDDSYNSVAPIINDLREIKRKVENAQASMDLKDFYNTHRYLMIVQNLHEGLANRNRHRVFSQNQEDSTHTAPACMTYHELHGPIDTKDLPANEDYYLTGINTIYIAPVSVSSCQKSITTY